MKSNVNLILESSIYFIRDKQVLLDRGLATLYGVESLRFHKRDALNIFILSFVDESRFFVFVVQWLLVERCFSIKANLFCIRFLLTVGFR